MLLLDASGSVGSRGFGKEKVYSISLSSVDQPSPDSLMHSFDSDSDALFHEIKIYGRSRENFNATALVEYWYG